MILNNHKNRRILASQMIDALDVDRVRVMASEALEEELMKSSNKEFDKLWDEWHEENKRDSDWFHKKLEEIQDEGKTFRQNEEHNIDDK